MTDLRKAAEMALEDICGAKLCELNSMSSRAEMLRLMDKAAEALRQALAESANSTTDFVESKVSSQPEQEPVAWVIEDGEVDYYVDVVAKIKPGTPLYTAPPQKRSFSEDVGRLLSTGKGFYDDGTPIDDKEIQLKIESVGDGVVTCTEVHLPRPPQKQWVGLTDEELREAYCEVSGKEWCLGGLANADTFYESIQAKLKEKNT